MKSILTTIAFLALAISGVAQTRNVIVNTNGVIQSPTNFWSADVTNARSGLGLGTAATSLASAFQPSSLALSNLASSNGGALTNLTASNITGTVALASNVTGTIAISNGGSGATTAGGARTNLGGTTVGNAVFTATNAAAAADAIGLGATNQVGFDSVQANDFTVSDGGTFSFEDTGSIEFGNAAGSTRTNLGIPLAALTNANNANFQAAIFNTNSAPTNSANVNAVNFNTAIHWMEVNVVTNGVTNNFRIPLFK